MAAHGQLKDNAMDTVAKQVACKLTTPELRKRKATIIAELKAFVLTRKELYNGLSYTFESSDAVLNMIKDFIKSERLCCPFFTFQITIGETVTLLTITGPNDAKEFLMQEIDL
jgi:hypothetical protein